MSPLQMAVLRGIGVALAAGLTAGLTMYMQGLGVDFEPVTAGTQPDPLLIQKSVITGLLAFLAAFAVRGGIEGGYDQHRANEGNVQPSDVPMAARQVQVVESGTGGTPVPDQRHP